MGSSDNHEYCAFTKAVEHLGDRWSLLIVRELARYGPQGFNELAGGLPGAISRSVLAARLRKLEALGIVAHGAAGRGAPYRLAPAGKQLVPTLKSLWEWAEHWVPEDPAMFRHDPAVVQVWLTERVDVAALPEQQVVLELAIQGTDADRTWLLLTRGQPPSICLEDPLLERTRYVYVEADAKALYPVARGLASWGAALGDGSIRLYGEPELVAALPGWFHAPQRSTARSGDALRAGAA